MSDQDEYVPADCMVSLTPYEWGVIEALARERERQISDADQDEGWEARKVLRDVAARPRTVRPATSTDLPLARTYEFEADLDYRGGQLTITLTEEGVVFDRWAPDPSPTNFERMVLDDSTWWLAREVFDEWFALGSAARARRRDDDQ